MGRGVIIALAISVALNVFAVGHLTGRMLSHGGVFKHPHGPQLPPPELNMRTADNPFQLMHYIADLPSERRELFREKIREQLPEMRRLHRDNRAVREEIIAMMGAGEWDRAAIEAKLLEIEGAQSLQRAAFTKSFLDALETLTPEERKQLAAEAEMRRAERKGMRGKRWREERRRMRDRPPPPDED